MTTSHAVREPSGDLREKVIVALDVSTAAEAEEIVGELRHEVGAFKIGLQLFTAAGPSIVHQFISEGIRIFLDLKFHDIPNTVASTGVEAARLGVWMFNVHAAGGSEMMRETVDRVQEVCVKEGIERPLVIGVTVLTSLDDEAVRETGISSGTEDQVVRLARLAAVSGLDGVVASPLEAALVRRAITDPSFCIVTPGIRPVSATSDDQRRVNTVRGALADGSDYVVIGRAILKAGDKKAALDELLKV